MSSIQTHDVQLLIPCEVEYEYHRAHRGARDGRYGPALEPDEDAEVEIVDITLDGKSVIEYVDDDFLNDLSCKILDGLD